MPGSATDVLKIAAAVVSDHEGRLLLVRKHHTSFYMQPGGKIEKGESALAALCRELREELGLQVNEDQLIPLGLQTAEAANEPGVMLEANLFGLVIDEPVEAAAEIAEAKWVTREEAWQLSLAPLTKAYIAAEH
ncbi:NUDIX hydrolase [Vreelandella sp. V005]|uniref:NUDIX hydrolase n=1 Tax=Vreelandella sp. V005 TaxID=3459608 RepID=UPI0040448F87